MSHTKAATLLAPFAQLEDPRIDRTRHYNLLDLIFIALCAVVSGANDFVAIAKFAKTKRDWLEKYLDLPEDTPSHDTFGRVFAAVGGQAFVRGSAPRTTRRAQQRWVTPGWHPTSVVPRSLPLPGTRHSSACCPRSSATPGPRSSTATPRPGKTWSRRSSPTPAWPSRRCGTAASRPSPNYRVLNSLRAALPTTDRYPNSRIRQHLR